MKFIIIIPTNHQVYIYTYANIHVRIY